jgi:uncharacterized protein
MTKTIFKILCITSMLCLSGAPAFAQEASAPVTADATTQIQAKPALWVVKDEDTTIYLFGTVHILKPGLSWFDGGIRQAFDTSDKLVLEMVEPSPTQAQALFMALGLDHDGKALRAKMNEDERAAYDKAMTGIGVPVAAFDPFDPWAAAVTMQVIGMTKQGFDAKNGAESVLTSAAKASKKPISGVETMASQLAVFDNLSEKKQLAFLIETAASMDEMKTGFDELIDSWAKPDPEKLASLMNEGLKDPELFTNLLTKRNANWARWINAQMAKPGTIFMAVGAGHLSGSTSVPMLLKAYGLSAERVVY